MLFEIILVLILFKFKTRPNISGFRVTDLEKFSTKWQFASSQFDLIRFLVQFYFFITFIEYSFNANAIDI